MPTFLGMTMKPILAVLLSSLAGTAWADWQKIRESGPLEYETFIDIATVRQRGPMATMRRVWEIRNVPEPAEGRAASTRTLAEYDCQNRRPRILEESRFSAHWSSGQELTPAREKDSGRGWKPLEPEAVEERIFHEVCPHDDGD
jgi:hypothetical protein